MINNTKFIKTKGQIFIESLFFIICLLGFVFTLSLFQKYASKEIHKHRLQKKSYKKHFNKGYWYFI